VKTTIRHGATIETATPAEVSDIVSRAFDEQRAEDYWPLADSITLVGGVGQDQYPAPPQYDWAIERFAIGPCTAGDTGIAFLYQDVVDPGAFIGGLAANGVNGASTGFSPRIIIPSNSFLIVAISGATSPSWAFRFQIKRFRSQRRSDQRRTR